MGWRLLLLSSGIEPEMTAIKGVLILLWAANDIYELVIPRSTDWNHEVMQNGDVCYRACQADSDFELKSALVMDHLDVLDCQLASPCPQV